jgi:hypothetical protein
MLVDRWKTGLIAPSDMTNSVINIRLPCNTNEKECWNYDINKLQREMEVINFFKQKRINMRFGHF